MSSLVQTDHSPIGMTLSGRYEVQGRTLFDGLDFRLEAGQWTCLLGTSGVGKSTLLRLLASLPTKGTFEGDVSIDQYTPDTKQIAYMAQDDLLFPWLSVKQNVMLGNRLRGEAQQNPRADALLEQVGLDKDVQKRPHQLSGGMRQRTALARTLMEDTPIVLLDEPFSALDTRNRKNMQALAHQALAGKTVLLVTHDPIEALRLADQLFVMTETGLHKQTLPASKPLRDTTSDEMLLAQTRVLAALNAI